jgi:hypothetical protein
MRYEKLPTMAGYVLNKVERYLNIGPKKYGISDALGKPRADTDPELMKKIQSGFEQLMKHKGFFRENPVNDIGIEAFHEMMLILHFDCKKVESFFQKDSIVDEMSFEHIVTGANIMLYNEVEK